MRGEVGFLPPDLPDAPQAFPDAVPPVDVLIRFVTGVLHHLGHGAVDVFGVRDDDQGTPRLQESAPKCHHFCLVRGLPGSRDRP